MPIFVVFGRTLGSIIFIMTGVIGGWGQGGMLWKTFFKERKIEIEVTHQYSILKRLGDLQLIAQPFES